WGDAAGYVAAQFAGTICGVIATHLMFSLHAISISTQARSGPHLWLSEFIATFGLLSIIWGCTRYRSPAAAFAVGAYIAAAYWFTSSTSFANPAVTVARCLTNTFTGIRPHDVPQFVLAQMAGAFAATAFFAWLIPSSRKRAKTVVARPS